MTLFSFLLFPLSILIYYFQKEKTQRKENLTVIFIGVLTASLFLAYKILFNSYSVYTPNNFIYNFLSIFFRHYFIPIVVVFGIFLLIANKDSIKDRISYFFPMMASFYAVYVPYIVFESDKPFTYFILFIKPLLIISTLILLHLYLNYIVSQNKTPKQFRFNTIVTVLGVLIPSVIEALWLQSILTIIWVVLSVLLFTLALTLIFPKTRVNND